MEQTTAQIWRRRIALWGTLSTLLLYILVYLSSKEGLNIIIEWFIDRWEYSLIFFFVISPLMVITGIAPLWKQPIPQKLMHWKILVFAMRAFLLLIYAGQLFGIIIIILNLISSS